MPTRQYVGARYVPKFADPITWDNANAYEALTIVTYNGTSYTSKKAVPAGTAISNTEYWVATGNYNAQVEEYRQEVEALADKNHNYRNVIIIGDSYGTTYGDITANLASRIASYSGLDSEHLHQSYVAGAGFGNGGFYTAFSVIADALSNDEKDDITDIYFVGGWNDDSARTSQSDFNTGAGNCSTLISSSFKNAKKHVVFDARSCRASTQSTLGTTMKWWDGLASNGWIVDKNVRYVLVNPSYMYKTEQEASHPNQSGVDALAKAMIDVIFKGNTDVNYAFTILYKQDITWHDRRALNMHAEDYIFLTVANGTATLRFVVPANNLWMGFKDANGDPETPTVTYDGGAWELGSFVDKIAGTGDYINMPIDCIIQMSDGTKYPCCASFTFKGNKIYFNKPYIPNAAVNSPESYATKIIRIGEGNVTFPTVWL